MKKKISLLVTTCFVVRLLACPVCDRQQPKLLRGIIHGAGPQNNWDYISVALMTLVAIYTLYYSVKWLIKPGETNSNHIKYSILNEH